MQKRRLQAWIVISLAIAMVKFCLAGDNNLVDKTNIQFIKGADISFIPQIEDNGGVYKEFGTPRDPIEIFKEHGFNYIRLKLWHAPTDGYNGLDKILYMALRVKALDLKLLLDFHYSDTWADPGHQQKPRAWQNISFDALKDSLYHYTKKVIQALDRQGTPPAMVQIGNEINSGLLWNDGRIGGSYDPNWANFAALIKEGIRGVRESCALGDSIKIMIHIANAANNTSNRWFFDNLLANSVNFDIIGLSFYPWWHGTLNQVKSNLNDLAGRYKKDIVIAEYAYPWTLQWFDNQNNIVGSQNQLHAGYPASVDGQASFIRDLMKIIRQTRDGRGIGLFYWAPEYISAPTFLSNWENNTLFDFQGNVLRSMDVFLEEPDTLAPINVRMIVNTATNWDTLAPYHFVQIRGEVQGISYLILPDGKKVTWDVGSDLVMNNIGGDYWQVEFQMYPGDKLSYKIWSGYSRSQPTYQRLGWEGPITPFEGSSDNTRIFVAGRNDTTIQVQYYNSSSEPRLQYWQPFRHPQDSVAVYFRVNLGGVIKSGRFDPAVNGPVGVRGDPIASGGCLDWSQTKLVLQREEYSVARGSFWSGVCYIPRYSIQPGQKLTYKFFIENDTQNGWENTIANRELWYTTTLTELGRDTTLHWVYFDNLNTQVGVENLSTDTPAKFSLRQNFPNPFNASTKIQYQLARSGWVTMKIYNLEGEEVITLVSRHQPPGDYSASWDGRDARGMPVASGIYFCRLSQDELSAINKLVLVK
ncbi:MAG: glycosyl hydrolase 53 family protein [candidate division KSB1 bacterium]|nr:glycosyl hydrolase 53 family protein [candidate division KSB1 bacterium]